MRYDAVFFDLDGTVMDSLQDIVNAINHTMRHFGLPEFPREQLRPLLGWGVGPLMQKALPELTDARRAEILAFYRPWYAAHACDVGRPFPGVVEVMARLRAMGLPVAILSNKPDAALQPIVKAFFAEVSDLAAGELPNVPKKPHPAMLENAAAALGVPLPRCLYVGDSEVDIDTAKNAHIDCVCVSWGFRNREALRAAGADIIIDTPDALIPIVTGQGQADAVHGFPSGLAGL